MSKGLQCSRRAMLVGVVADAATTSSATFGKLISVDAELIELGRQFDAVASEFDQAIEKRADLNFEILSRLDEVEATILSKKAATVDGLRVKARAACWAQLGDMDASDQSSMDVRMAMSIVRDLIRAYDPDLERPDALIQVATEAD